MLEGVAAPFPRRGGNKELTNHNSQQHSPLLSDLVCICRVAVGAPCAQKTPAARQAVRRLAAGVGVGCHVRRTVCRQAGGRRCAPKRRRPAVCADGKHRAGPGAGSALRRHKHRASEDGAQEWPATAQRQGLPRSVRACACGGLALGFMHEGLVGGQVFAMRVAPPVRRCSNCQSGDNVSGGLAGRRSTA